jgi:predicted DNA-binding antitoxin AbrB/MazE fold protein
MSITLPAIFENGVFRPTEPVALPENCRVELVVRQESAATTQSSTVAPLAALAALAESQPANPNLPSDLAAQHDHYLYGAAKR